MITELGRGVQGAVFKVKYQGKLACAKKFLGPEDIAKYTMLNEVEMMKLAQKSGCTPKILAEYHSQNVIIMELCKGKTLKDYLNEDKPSPEAMHKIVYKLVNALAKLN